MADGREILGGGWFVCLLLRKISYVFENLWKQFEFLENGQVDLKSLKSLPAQLDNLECGDVDWPLHRTLEQ